MLLAALVAVTSFAQPVKKSQGVLGSVMMEQAHKPMLPKTAPNVKGSMPMPNKAVKKVPRKEGLADLTWPIDGLALNYQIDNNLESAPVPVVAYPTTVNMVDDTHVSFVGLVEGGNVEVTVELNLEEGTFSIPDGTVVANTEYGNVAIFNASEEGSPITGSFSDEGISLNNIWYDSLIDGDYEGERWSSGYFFYTPAIVPANGTMAFTHPSRESPVSVYIEQDNYTTTVYNFGGTGAVITIDMKEDNVFEIQKQLAIEGSTTTGDYYTNGLNADATGLLNPITGTGNENTLTFDCNWTFYSSNGYWYNIFSGTTITLTDGSEFEFPVIEDVAAMPADPSVIRINPYKESNGYGSIVVDVPNVDVEGNLIKEGKLFYVIYGQKDGEITKITYPADLYENLDEDLTEIPYTLNDSYDFDITDDGYKVVYLNFEFDYDTMGVQSIYYGGGEVNATEIFWYVPEPSELIEAQWVAAEQGYENTEEVTNISISEEDGISGVFAQAEGTNPPKYYDRGESVRMYAGNTLTISSSEYPIEKIEVTFGSRVDFELASEEGVLTYDEETSIATWEGEANEVVFDVPQGLTPAGQAYIVAISVYYAMPQLVLELIELPDGATVDEYKFVATVSYEQPVYDEETGEETGETEIVTEEVERPVFVAFVDDQVYIQGLSEVCPDGWAVGTMTDNVLTIPVEYLGEYEYIDWEAMVMYTYDMAIDKVVINYDPEKDEFTTSSLTVSAYYGGESLGAYEEYADVVITKINDVAATPADPYFTGWNLDVNATNYPSVRYEIPTVDTEGNTILTSKLAYIFWVETEEGQSQYTCVAGVYSELEEDMTEIPATFSDGWDIYTNRLYVYTDAEDFTAWKKIGIQSVYYGGGERHESNIVWQDLTEYWEAVGIEDITAADAKSVKFYDLQGRQVTADAKGVVIRVAQMANGSTKTTKMLRK